VRNLHDETFAYLKVSEADHVLRIHLNRPEKRNAMNPKMMEEIAFAMSYANHTPGVWAVVLSAEGKIWSAGADLKSFAGDKAEETVSTIPDARDEILVGELFMRVHKPTIVQVDAPVYAGGHMLVGGALYVIATPNASFSLPEVKRGLFPFQVMEVLMQTLPPRQVLDWCIRGSSLTAQEATDMGLVSHFAEDATDMQRQTEALLAEIFANSPAAIRLGLEAYDKLRHTPRKEAHAYLKAMLNSTIRTQDAQEGLAAFQEKRSPAWTGE
jgi:enoyl-CoA hydratase/carnithine racemase